MSHWIPVTEREPEKMAVVLASLLNGTVIAAKCRGNRWWVSKPGEYTARVVAWMPLPAAYVPTPATSGTEARR